MPIPVLVPVTGFDWLMPVPVLVPVTGFDKANPRFWLKLETKPLNPVPKFVLNPVGAIPNPMNPGVVPVANPPLNPLKNELPVNGDPKRLVKPLVGKTRFDGLVIPKNELSGVARLWKALPKALETAVLNPEVPYWRLFRRRPGW